MVSSKAFLEYILGQLSDLDDVAYRPMMGEFIIYYRGKIVGGIYDDRFLVKPVRSAVEYLGKAPFAVPYEGAKEMLLVEDTGDKKFLAGLLEAMIGDLPEPKNKKG